VVDHRAADAPATGSIGSAPAPLLAAEAQARAARRHPNGDGRGDEAKASVPALGAATVTARSELARTPVATVFDGAPRPASRT
jgi:hypothetical protein